jgi:hypothetical protein
MGETAERRKLSGLRARGDYWWKALRHGWPHLWRAAGVLTLLVGGSALAVIVLVIGEPMLGLLIFLAVLLITLAEGTYRLSRESQDTPRGMSVEELQDFAETVRTGAFDTDPYGTTPAQSDERAMRVAVASIRQELKTIRLRLVKAKTEAHLGYDFFLPSEKWNEHSDRIARVGASDLREQGDTLYTRLDELNRDAQRRNNNGSSVTEADDLGGLIKLLDRFDETLRGQA